MLVPIVIPMLIPVSAGSGASGHSASWGRANPPTSPPYESHLHSLVSNLAIFIFLTHVYAQQEFHGQPFWGSVLSVTILCS